MEQLKLHDGEQNEKALIDLQKKFKTTFVYVTHDQMEALTVSDKMAIFNENGQIEQIGTSKEIYEFPSSRFVAGFVGRTNIMEGVLRMKDDKVEFEGDNEKMEKEKYTNFELLQAKVKVLQDHIELVNKILMENDLTKITESYDLRVDFDDEAFKEVEED